MLSHGRKCLRRLETAVQMISEFLQARRAPAIAAPAGPVAVMPANTPVWLSRSTAPDAQDVALLHGFLESNAVWRRLCFDAFGARVNALAMSLPGHYPCQMEAAALAQSVRSDALIDGFAAELRSRFSGRKVRLIGHSTGALIALSLAARHPGLVSDVLVVTGLFSGQPEGRSPLLRRLFRIPFLGSALFRGRLRWCLRSRARFAAELRASMLAGVSDTEVAQDLWQDLRKSRVTTIEALARWLCDADLTADLRKVQVPVVVMVGSRDVVVPPLHQIALVKALPRCRAVILDAGHLPMLEAPGTFNRFLQGWLAQPVGQHQTPKRR